MNTALIIISDNYHALLEQNKSKLKFVWDICLDADSNGGQEARYASKRFVIAYSRFCFAFVYA